MYSSSTPPFGLEEWHAHPESPTWPFRTLAPVTTTMPAPSVPGTIGKFVLGPQGRHDPSRTRPSQEPTPAAWRAMRTSRGPGLGTGRRWGVRTEGGPNRSIAAAFIVGGIVDCRAPSATRFVMASPSGLGPVLRSEKGDVRFLVFEPVPRGVGL